MTDLNADNSRVHLPPSATEDHSLRCTRWSMQTYDNSLTVLGELAGARDDSGNCPGWDRGNYQSSFAVLQGLNGDGPETGTPAPRSTRTTFSQGPAL